MGIGTSYILTKSVEEASGRFLFPWSQREQESFLMISRFFHKCDGTNSICWWSWFRYSWLAYEWYSPPVKNAVDQTDEGQFIATTHNTLLMDSVPADEVYVLKADAEGEKRLSVSRTIDSVRRRQTVLDINIWMAAIKESQKLDTWILQNLLMKLWN